MKKTLLLLALYLNGLVFAQSVTKTMQLLPDTGQISSYTTTFGEDNDYAINTPSYTDNGDGTITDNITGLMWQQADGGEMTFENALIYCNTLTFAGYSDWRLPSPKESFSILNQQYSNPATNTTFFTITAADYWWTNTFQVNDSNKVWVTNAGGGIGNHPKTETLSAGGTKKFHVRAVRDTTTPVIIPNHFTDNADGTVTDNLTQLVWQQVPNATALSWEQAIGYAESLSLAGYNDWRLPNIKELQSLNDDSRYNPSVATNFFSNVGVGNYWSSTTLKPNPTNPSSAWYWNTSFGITSYDLKSNSNYVLCVRGIPTTLGIATSITNQAIIAVYPNPFVSKITVGIPNSGIYCELYTASGQLLYVGTAIDKQDFSTLPKGTYTLKLKDTHTSGIQLLKQ